MDLIRLLQGDRQPEVDLARTYDAVVIGSGDREHPLAPPREPRVILAQRAHALGEAIAIVGGRGHDGPHATTTAAAAPHGACG